MDHKRSCTRVEPIGFDFRFRKCLDRGMPRGDNAFCTSGFELKIEYFPFKKKKHLIFGKLGYKVDKQRYSPRCSFLLRASHRIFRISTQYSNNARNSNSFISPSPSFSFLLSAKRKKTESALQRRKSKRTVIDILFRVDDICKKYEKYDIDKQRELDAFGDDAFARQFSALEDDIDAALQKAELVSTETNRAAVAAMNADIRRTKARLMDEIPKLKKLALKKVKGLSKEEQQIRSELVLTLPERIQAIPDGISAAGIPTTGWTGSSSNKKIIFDSSDAHLHDHFYQESEESSQFRQEYEMRKLKQDQGLNVISEGLSTLKSMAHDMNEELDRQVPLVDEIDTKVDKTTSEIKNTNKRLKKTIHEMRSSRNFCIDIILLCVLLGIAAYLYKVLK